MKWTYRVAFAHKFVDFIVGVGSSSGRKGDSFFLCGTSRHCGSDWEDRGKDTGEREEREI